MKAAAELAGQVGVKPACDALGVCGATFYRRLRPMTGHQQPSPTPARALSEKEQDEVFDILCSQRFVDRSPAEVVATLVDEGVYLCSERTMYRVLASRAAVQERRPQRTHPEYKKPELMATGPNQVWSWDITRLLGPKKWSYFYLYVILDIFSRYAVGWMVADRENSALAGRLIQQSCLKYGVQPRVLTLHSDRGAPMTSQCTAQLLADLGVTRSLSRPQVSDDNPFSEAQFKTLKYHPSFPGRFDDQGQAKNFCRSFFPWYNAEHRHGGISMLTPEQLHFGLADEIIARREAVLRAAWAAHPDRFVSGEPKPKPLPEAVWINPPTPTLPTQEIALQLIPPSVSQPLTGSGSHQPLYQQIVDRIWSDVIEGTLEPGQRLPTARQLAVNLGVHPDTVSRAYQQLERLGLVRGRPGAGTFVGLQASRQTELEQQKRLDQICRIALQDAELIGASIDDLMGLLIGIRRGDSPARRPT